MSMQRTIFEIPENLEKAITETLENHPISYSLKPIPGSTLLEVEITYSKSQNYIIELIEQDLNLVNA